MQADYKKASEAFEQAVAAEPNRSDAHMWLGRSYGRRAESSSIFTAPSLASKSRAAFEKAVALDPGNKEALNDLFEYYLQAPGFMGGGEDKAKALVDKIARLDPAERYFAEARLAEHRKEYKSAEASLRRAVDVAPRQIGRIVDLARFLARQGRIQESEDAFLQAEKIDANAPALLFSRAESYVQAKRNLPQAKALLERYLASQLTPDDPPKSEAQRLLRQAGGE
jgi:tetratricopeptide (TPR) repeat protein